MPNIIGLDLGTTTVTGVLLDVEHGAILRLAQFRNDAALPRALPTRAEQSPQRLRTLALAVLAELAAGDHPVDGLALTGQMHGLLCVDTPSQPVTPLISWQDRRTAEPMAGGSTALELLHRRLEGLDWHENGCRIEHGYGAATLFWLVQQGELPAAVHRVCTITDWLAAQLTGRPVVTDPTFAASWGIYNLVEDSWNSAFLSQLGLEARLLPSVQPSGAPLGGLLPEFARQVALPEGLPVFNTLGDNQASFLGSVAEPENALLFNLGTGGQVCWMVPRFEPPTETVEIRPLPFGRFLRVGASLCGGAAYAWLNRTVRAWLADFGVEPGEQAVYEGLNALATESSDTKGLRVRTTFLGVRGDPTVQSGAIEGITLYNLELGALVRATSAGAVDELYGLYQAHGGASAGHTRLVAAGGGVWKNPLMPGLLEARFALPVEKPRYEATGAAGAAALSQLVK
jgi:sugar (pentulose or hexulose) kinase